MCKSSTCTSDRPQILLWSPFRSLSSPSLPCLCSLPIKKITKNRQLSTQCQTNCCVIAASEEQEKLNFIKINWRQHMSNIKPIQPNRPTPTTILELRSYGWMPPPTSWLHIHVRSDSRMSTNWKLSVWHVWLHWIRTIFPLLRHYLYRGVERIDRKLPHMVL